MEPNTPVRCGVLGTGWMLGKYVEATRLIDSASLVAIASRDGERAKAAAAKYGIARALPSYESLINDPEIDVVINALHNGLHCEWSTRALQAGKHVLCEKPLACSSTEVERMFATAHASQRSLMEGFMYRFHPQMIEAKRRVAEGQIGRVHYIRSSRTAYGRDRSNPRFWRDAGGGALMDIGCYCVNLARFFADGEPHRAFAHARFDPQADVDLTLSGMLEFPDDVTAQFVCSMEAEPSYTAEIIGTEGKLLIPHPWFPPTWPVEFSVTRRDKTEAVRIEETGLVGAPFQARPGSSEARPHNLLLLPFALEIDHFCRATRENRSPQFPPGLDVERDARGNMRAIEALLASARNERPILVNQPL